MKAIVLHEYGSPDNLQWDAFPDPVPGDGQVLVRVAATSINPIDLKQRSGEMKEYFPVEFPGVLGVDVAGTIAALGAGVEGFAVGDRVFAMAEHAYAQLCAVPIAGLVKIPEGMDTIDAAALPLVTTTGYDLIAVGADIQAGQTVLITGAAGNVGRSAVYTAKSRGATVIAGVKGNQIEAAANLGADQVIALDDRAAVDALPSVDAVADTVGGETAAALLAKVKEGGIFASVLGPPPGAENYPSVQATDVQAEADSHVLQTMAQAVRDGKLTIPVARKMPLSEAASAHELSEKGGVGGKILLIAEPNA